MQATIESREPELREQVKIRQLKLVQRIPSPSYDRPLFSDSFLEPLGQEKRRRTWTTTLSFIFQCLLLGLLVVLPLMFTEDLPRQQLLTYLVAPPPPPPPPPPAAEAVAKVVRQMTSEMMNGQLRTPSQIPQKVQMIREEEAPVPVAVGGVVGGVPGGIPGGQLGGVIGGIINSSSTLAAVPKLIVPAPKRIRVSQGITEGRLIKKIPPYYPPIALQARVTGQVVLKAIIDKDGQITELEVVSGHPMLVPAAMAAVRQWRYRPFLLNGVPVEVETTVTAIFQISN